MVQCALLSFSHLSLLLLFLCLVSLLLPSSLCPVSAVSATASASPAGSPPKPSLSPTELKSLADVSLEKGDYATALSHYSDLISLQPSQLTYFHRANAYLRKRAYGPAVADLSSAVKSDAQFVKGYLYRAKVYKITGRCEEAVVDYGHVLQLQPSQKEAVAELPKAQQCSAQLQHSQQLMQARQWESARHVLSSVLDVAYDSSALLYQRALCHYELADHQSVLVDTRKILQHDQRHIDALFIRGQAYLALGEHDNAMTHFKEALRQDPEEKRVKDATKKLRLYLRFISNGEEALGEKRWEDALDAFSSAIEADEKDARQVKLAGLHVRKCEALVGLKRGKDAVAACSRAIQMEDGNIDAWIKRGEAKILLAEYQEAVNDYQKATQIDQHNQSAAHAPPHCSRTRPRAPVH